MLRRYNWKVSWTKNPLAPNRPPFYAVAALPSPKRGAAAAMMLMVPLAPYNLCLPHRAPFTSRPIAIGVVHHRRAAAVGASDDDAEELLTLVKD